MTNGNSVLTARSPVLFTSDGSNIALTASNLMITTLAPNRRVDAPPVLRFLAWQDEWRTNQPGAACHADGSGVTNPDEQQWLKHVSTGGISGGSEPQPRYLQLWFSHPHFDTDTFAEVALLDDANNPIPPAGMGSICGSLQGADAANGNQGWLVQTLGPAPAAGVARHLTVRLRYATGPLENINLTLSPEEHMSATLEGESLLNGAGQRADGKAFVSIAVNSAKMQSRKFDVVAETKDGRVGYAAKGESGFAGRSGVSVAQFTFDTPLTNVAKFIIGTRAVHTNEWRDVELPGARPAASAGN
jgi:hypothetical protein